MKFACCGNGSFFAVALVLRSKPQGVAHFFVGRYIVHFFPLIRSLSIGDFANKSRAGALDFVKNALDDPGFLVPSRGEILISIAVDQEMKIEIASVIDNVESTSADNVNRIGLNPRSRRMLWGTAFLNAAFGCFRRLGHAVTLMTRT